MMNRYLIIGGEDGRGRMVIVIAIDEKTAVAKYQEKYKESCYVNDLDDWEYRRWKEREPQIEEIV